MNSDSESLERRETCPQCGYNVEAASVDPLEEYCLNAGCDYYRAEGMNGVIRQ